MSDTFILMSGLTQDVDGPTNFYTPLLGETLTATLTGSAGGGNGVIEVLDGVENTWSTAMMVTDDVPGPLTFVVANSNATAVRARLVGSVNPNATITVGVAP